MRDQSLRPKRLIACAAVLIMLALTVVVPARSALSADNRGSLTFGWPMGVPNLDPMKAVGNPATVFYPIVFDALTKIDGAKVAPALAVSWELQKDNVTWIVKLRRGVTFSNGEPFDASAVKFSFERAMNPANGLGITGRVVTIKDVQVVDTETVRFVSNNPDPIFPRRIAAIYMLPPRYFNDVGQDKFVNAPVGTGAFRVVSYQPLARISLEAWDGSWRGAPRLRALVIDVLPNADGRVKALLAGDVEFAMWLTADDARAVKAKGFTVIPGVIGQAIQVTLDPLCRETPGQACPIADKRVRQALNFAVDKTIIANRMLGGFVTVMNGQQAIPGTVGYNPALKPYPYDPAKAKHLLADAGYPNGFSVDFEYSANDWDEVLVSEAVAGYLQAIGVHPNLMPQERAVWLDHFWKARAPLFTAAWTWSPAQDADFVLVWASTLVDAQRRRYGNAEFQTAYLASTTEMNPGKREKLLQQAYAALHDDPPDIFLVNKPDIWAASKRVQGLQLQSTGIVDFDKLSASGK